MDTVSEQPKTMNKNICTLIQPLHEWNPESVKLKDEEFANKINDGWEILELQTNSIVRVSDGISQLIHYRIVTLTRDVPADKPESEITTSTAAVEQSTEPQAAEGPVTEAPAVVTTMLPPITPVVVPTPIPPIEVPAAAPAPKSVPEKVTEPLPIIECPTRCLEPGDVIRQQWKMIGQGGQETRLKVVDYLGEIGGQHHLILMNLVTEDISDVYWYSADLTLVAGPKCEAYALDKTLCSKNTVKFYPQWNAFHAVVE